MPTGQPMWLVGIKPASRSTYPIAANWQNLVFRHSHDSGSRTSNLLLERVCCVSRPNQASLPSCPGLVLELPGSSWAICQRTNIGALVMATTSSSRSWSVPRQCTAEQYDDPRAPRPHAPRPEDGRAASDTQALLAECAVTREELRRAIENMRVNLSSARAGLQTANDNLASVKALERMLPDW